MPYSRIPTPDSLFPFRGYLKSFLILNFAPLAPQLWGEQESICF
ncbi:hypothetical protein [Moorena sp. SIO4A1]|nr:hypothetical protein [Moorena sp. SIO4A1]